MKKFTSLFVASAILMGVGFSVAPTAEAAKVKVEVAQQSTPTIKGIEDVTIPMGSKFDALQGVSLVDGNGKVIPNGQVLVSNNFTDTYKEKSFVLTYVAFDGQGNYLSQKRTVTVKAMTDNKPELNVSGQVIFRGSVFNPLDYATALDKEDGNISKNIQVKGTVDTSVSGPNQLTYSITDSAGNTESKTVIMYVM
ncbi:immunoglobulin-like domain-containing protein [Carnobacterium maltaromaticum]|uniref:immunoglobulin-like domain-containing protein n=1 Tax=Carnobacterium maltaromaticum TaxID=2751 RepID=UPI0039BE9877